MSTFMPREPTSWMNYPGDVRAGIEAVMESGLALGPTTMNEPLYPVEANYVDKTDTTRVGFSYIAPPEKATA